MNQTRGMFIRRLSTMFAITEDTRSVILDKSIDLGISNEEMPYYQWMVKLDLLKEDGVCRRCGLPLHIGRCLGGDE